MRLSSIVLKPIAVVLAASLVVVVLTLMATTNATKTTSGMTFYENTTFKFMVSVVPNEWVDPTGQRFWVATWPGGTKCIAGANVAAAGRQITFNLLRWSWRG